LSWWMLQSSNVLVGVYAPSGQHHFAQRIFLKDVNRAAVLTYRGPVLHERLFDRLERLVQLLQMGLQMGSLGEAGQLA